MRVLLRYTLDTLRKNRRTTLACMAAILLSSTLLSALCIYVYTQLTWQADIEEHYKGSWHGELGGELVKEDLEVVDNTLSVEKTMVKGPCYSARLSDDTMLPYLVIQEADQGYWDEMWEKNSILEGHVPMQPGEIVVSKTFFDKHPQYRLGDTITLPVGNRVIGDQFIDTGVRQEGEDFRQTGEKSLTLVGKLDVTTPTSLPGYYAMGYLDRASLTDSDQLTIYLKMKNIRKVYQEMSNIAEALGMDQNEYGGYDNYRCHTKLLAMKGVFDPERELKISINKLTYVAIVLLVAAAFVVIIHSAFALSAGARIRQLGMFRSVGATPGQIGFSILFEGIVLSVIPIPLSMGLGYLFSLGVFRIYTGILGDLLFYPITVRFSFPLAVTGAVISLATVVISSYLPARRAAKMSPIEAIRGGKKSGGLKKAQRYPVFGRLFGFPGELASSSYAANRHAFRSSITALSLCLVMVAGFFCFLRINDLITEFNRNQGNYGIFASINSAWEVDEDTLREAVGSTQILEKAYYSNAFFTLWVEEEQQTEEFTANGGFQAVDSETSDVIERDGKYGIRTILFGMDNETFDSYCSSIGQDPEAFYDQENPRAIAVSWAPRYPNTSSSVKAKEGYPLLKLAPGQKLVVEEKTSDTMKTDYKIPITVGAVASETPSLDYLLLDYNVALYFPMEIYYAMAENFLSENAADTYTVSILAKTNKEDEISVVEQMRDFCEANWTADDVYIISNEEEARDNEISSKAMKAVVNCIGFLLGLIGVSNALSAVSNSLRQRRKEFAMLRSVGMDMDDVRRLLAIESLRMIFTPVLFGVPITLLISGILVGLTDITWKDFMGSFPLTEVVLSSVAVMAAVAFAYWISAGQIRRDIIIEAIRDDKV